MEIYRSILKEKKYLKKCKVELKQIPSNNEYAVINIYNDVEYQTVFGFGGAFTESAAYNFSCMSDQNKQKVLKAYFDKECGLGYTLGRTHINSCDFSLNEYTYVQENDENLSSFDIEREYKYVIPFIQKAQEIAKEKLNIFSSPWSPPAYMKDSKRVNKGGKILDEYKPLWAKYYAKYIQEFSKANIDIFAVTIQNEPNARQSWESCEYTPEEEKDFLKNYLIPTFKTEGLDDKKFIIWDHNKERVYDRAKAILSDEEVIDKVFAVGHHWYSGTHFDSLRLVYEKFHKNSFSTEICATIDSSFENTAERYAVEMCENFNNYDIAECDWNLLLSTNGGPYHSRNCKTVADINVTHDSTDGGCAAPILYDKEKDELIFTPIYYYIAHFSKFVKRGAIRIATTKWTEELNVCAFKNPNGEIVVVLINTTDKDLPAVLRFNDKFSEINVLGHSIMTVLL